MPVGPQLSLSSNRVRAEEKQKVTISCTVTGQPTPRITWSKAGGSLPGGRIHVQDGTLKSSKSQEKMVEYTFVKQRIFWVRQQTLLSLLYTLL